MITNLIMDKVIKELEAYLASHTPEIQSFLLGQIGALSTKMIEYIEEKIKEFENKVQ